MRSMIFAAIAVSALLATASVASAQTAKCSIGKSMVYTYDFAQVNGRPSLVLDLEYVGQKCEKGSVEKYVLEGFPFSSPTLEDLKGTVARYRSISAQKRELGPKFDEALAFVEKKQNEADAATAPLKDKPVIDVSTLPPQKK